MNFIEEFEKLRLKTPRLFNINIGSENSDYCTHSDKNKNCYLLFAANFNEDCMYGGMVLECRDCVDCMYTQHSELCYQCVDTEHSYSCNYCQEVKHCSDCAYCYDCAGCQNCFGCVGLRQKQHYFFNEKFSKEEYEKRVAQFDLKKSEDRRRAEEMLEELKRKIPRQASHCLNSQNYIGDFILNSKNCLYCFNTYDSEDCIYTTDVMHTKDSMDIMFIEGAELCYECFSGGLNQYNCNFCNYVRTCSDCEYCELCFNCKNCFGCAGLQNKEYYILNQPYPREEYFKRVAEIKSAMRADGSYGKHLPTTYKYEDTAAVWYK